MQSSDKLTRFSKMVSSTLLRLLAIATLAAILPSATPALATDAEAPITDASAPDSGSQFVRMGLNKSIVVRLPADARDVIVGSPDIIDAVVRRKNMAYIFARSVGQSNVFFFDANGEQILALDVEVAVDSLALRKLLNRTFPGNRITVDTVNSDIVLGGFAKNILEAKQAVEIAGKFAKSGGTTSGAEEKVVSVIDTMKIIGEDQVMLKVKIVEIKRDVLKQLGVDLQAVFSLGENVINLSNLNPFSLAGFPAATGNAIQDNTGNTRFNGILRALESDGLSRTLAEPNLTALSGEQAKFHVGGEFPYTVCDRDNVCQVNFREFGVSLAFKPVVLDENRINLNLSTDVSELSGTSVLGIPSLDSRKTQTVLELPSGGSMMIAGLIRESTRQNLNGFPGLKKLPVLGSLFRSREFQASQTELVVIVTPYLVNPVATAKLNTPDKNFNPATERQSLFFGKLHKTYGTNGRAPAGKYNGNVGFIVE
jgi:pilus assembly protein CpaC